MPAAGLVDTVSAGARPDPDRESGPPWMGTSASGASRAPAPGSGISRSTCASGGGATACRCTAAAAGSCVRARRASGGSEDGRAEAVDDVDDREAGSLRSTARLISDDGSLPVGPDDAASGEASGCPGTGPEVAVSTGMVCSPVSSASRDTGGVALTMRGDSASALEAGDGSGAIVVGLSTCDSTVRRWVSDGPARAGAGSPGAAVCLTAEGTNRVGSSSDGGGESAFVPAAARWTAEGCDPVESLPACAGDCSIAWSKAALSGEGSPPESWCPEVGRLSEAWGVGGSASTVRR